jgi:ABC-type lipoprotein export system ATPase subunit
MWLELENVRVGRRRGERAAVLEDVSLGLARGELVGILGPSGSGKTALLHVLGGLVRPDAGRYALDGVRVDRLSDAELARLRGRRIGMLFARSLLVPELSALENVEVPLAYQRVAGAERRARAAAILGELGLGAHLRRRPRQLSPGERRRVALARALVVEPELVLADDPARGLDARAGDEILDLLASRSALGAAVVVASEDPLRARCARRLVRLCEGRVQPELCGGPRLAGRSTAGRGLRRARR